MSGKPDRAIHVRRRADTLARERAAESKDILGALSLEETRQMLHDLRVHQIELEMQNDELRRTEGELDTARTRYFDLYDLAPVGYLTLSRDGLIQEANLTAALMLGVARGALVGLPFSRYVRDPDSQSWHLCRKRALATGAPESHELRMAQADGTYFWAQIEAAATEAEEGVPVLRLVLSNVTDRKLAEIAFRASDLRYRALFNSSLDAIIVSSPDGSIHAANPAACRLFGETEAEMKQVGRASIMDPADPRIAQALEERERTGAFRGELTLLRRNGEKFEGEVTAAASVSEDGGPGLSIVIVRDTTTRRAAEQALHSSLHEKQALLHEIHHRVKNNLQVITSLLRMEARRSAEIDTNTVLKTMQNRIQSLALLHETLYRSGTFASVDLGAYLTQVANHSFRAATDESQRITLALDLAPVRVLMDQAIPCGLLVNELISNCLKHAFPDGRRGVIRVVLQPAEGGADHRLAVSDTGAGLPADFADRRGKSLGLQLASDLAGQIGGKLENGGGPGSEFSLVFPGGVQAGTASGSESAKSSA